MKVTVTFGDTAVVVPCKTGWTVRDLIDQASRRYRRILEQYEDLSVKIHHLEYTDGGILDMDDLLNELVEDKDRLIAVFDKVKRGRTDSPRDNMSNYSSGAPSPEPLHYHSHLQFLESNKGEIEVNEAVLKANTPLMVRSSSDSALAPAHDMVRTPTPEDPRHLSPEVEINHVLKGALDRLHTDSPPFKMNKVNYSSLTKTVEFPGDQRPLGIHVVPYYSSLSGRTLGLHVRGIEENSRSRKENLFKEDECIVQINDTPLEDKTFGHSQEVFRQAMSSPMVYAEVLPVANKLQYEKSLIGQLFNADDLARTKSPTVVRARIDSQPEAKPDPKVNQLVRRPGQRSRTPDLTALEVKSETSSLERVSPTPPERAASTSPQPNTHSHSQPPSMSPVSDSMLDPINKKGGKRMKIDLKKGPEGLGFTVVTRDSSINGRGPILIKNILPRGAAVKDGRLQPGDRILEVNGVDMTDRSQEELVAMLRSTKQGESVSLMVSRQEDLFLPRELKGEEANSVLLEDGREQLMYEIPLNETGSAGLGVSLKGNKSKETGEDLGIFIKSIIHGGAAYKDGRLTVNDQLVAVNGESLLGHSNHTAMETLRRSMSSEGNARGTIQLVVLRAPRQKSGFEPGKTTEVSSAHQHNPHAGSSNQDPRLNSAGPSRASETETGRNATGRIPAPNDNYSQNREPRHAPHPTATTNGSYSQHYNEDEELDFPRPPSPRTMEQINRNLRLKLSQHSDSQMPQHQLINNMDNHPRSRESKSMDMVADESNVASLVAQKKKDPSAGTALGPTLGLWKSSSLESLQTAVSEAKQNHFQAQAPIHRPRPHMVRGRGCNQSFRIAIDKSYDGPSEDDDELSEQSSGHETPVSTSSRQGLDTEEEKKNKTKGKKKEKKNKVKKKTDDSGEDLDKKTKKKGFGLLRFGKKKEDKNKDTAKSTKGKLEVLSEEDVSRVPDTRDGYDPRYADVHSGHATPDTGSFPDMDDDDMDPNYARIDNFRQPTSPQSFNTRTPSPAAAVAPQQPQPSVEELDGLYARVNKSRPPQVQANSDQQIQSERREYQQTRAAPVYEDLDAARRRILENDPNRMAPRAAEPRRGHLYEDIDNRHYSSQPRRDPYDYPIYSRPVKDKRDAAPGHYHDQPASSHTGRVPLPQSGTNSQQPPGNQRYHPSSSQQHLTVVRQDVPPSPTAGHEGQDHYRAVRGRGDAHRDASPGRVSSRPAKSNVHMSRVGRK
ncbi:par-3 family cell polarity regulator beta a isoform X2 [Cynoglossus semilaevis]|uniref:par-3 family cell polarity regulator beta a isoform X2 n=1 Tax=Cynoglossus semilaevis TaxID=244447 RepID=UPI000D62C5B7|nr:partitioning defective 3 homolog B isoform X2 [Cynoglossus semilaevis]